MNNKFNSKYKIGTNEYGFLYDSKSNKLEVFLIEKDKQIKLDGLPKKVASWTPPFEKDGIKYITFWLTVDSNEVYKIVSKLNWKKLSESELLIFPTEDC